jgi:ABC-type multidrug transport system fused ATPase/permease subunit
MIFGDAPVAALVGESGGGKTTIANLLQFAERGTHDQLLGDNGLYRSMCKPQEKLKT